MIGLTRQLVKVNCTGKLNRVIFIKTLGTGDKCLSPKRTFLFGWYIIVFRCQSIQS